MCDIISQGLDLSGERRDLNFIFFFKGRIGEVHFFLYFTLVSPKIFRKHYPKNANIETMRERFGSG